MEYSSLQAADIARANEAVVRNYGARVEGGWAAVQPAVAHDVDVPKSAQYVADQIDILKTGRQYRAAAAIDEAKQGMWNLEYPVEQQFGPDHELTKGIKAGSEALKDMATKVRSGHGFYDEWKPTAAQLEVLEGITGDLLKLVKG